MRLSEYRIHDPVSVATSDYWPTLTASLHQSIQSINIVLKILKKDKDKRYSKVLSLYCHCTVLQCTALLSTVQYCHSTITVLHCTVTVLYCHCTVQYCHSSVTVLYCTVTVLHCHCAALSLCCTVTVQYCTITAFYHTASLHSVAMSVHPW